MKRHGWLSLGVAALLLSGCSWLSSVRCTHCVTACCYIESTRESYREAGCFEYTGSQAQAQNFIQSCSGKKSLPNEVAAAHGVLEKCRQGPVTGVPCGRVNTVHLPECSNCCPIKGNPSPNTGE